jgi:hypothetical protein
MNERKAMSVEGRLVTSAQLHRRLSEGPPEEVMLFRSGESWNLVVVHPEERWAENGAMVSAKANIWAEAHADLLGLEKRVRDRWGTSSWESLLESGHEEDHELHEAWVPMRIEAELREAYVFDPDLAVSRGYLDEAQRMARGREDPEWRHAALQAMTALLQEQGWHVGRGRPELLAGAHQANTVVGGLCARRHGRETALVVRVDDYGEIYARHAEPGEVRGRSLTASKAENDERSLPDEQARQLGEGAAGLAEHPSWTERDTWDNRRLDRLIDRGWDDGIEGRGLGR